MRETEMTAALDRYMNAFNAADLDGVMACFADDAIYEPGDGKSHRGKAQIRAAFEPQFHGAFGAMRFDEDERVIDAEHGTVALRWICRHDLARFQPHGLVNRMQKLAAEGRYGRKFGWHGVDIMHLDANGLITEKYSYAWFGSRPHLQSSLG